jgi:hypothetical protein
MHLPNEIFDDGLFNKEKFLSYHTQKLEVLLSKLREIEALTYNEYIEIVDEIIQWQYITEIIYSIDRTFESMFASLINEVNETLIQRFDFYLGQIDKDLKKIKDADVEVFQIRKTKQIIEKLSFVTEDLKKYGFIDKLSQKIDELNEKYNLENIRIATREETSDKAKLAKAIIVLAVEIAFLISFLVGLTILGDPFLLEPPDFLSFLTQRAYQAIALSFSGLVVVGFIIFMSIQYRSLEYVSSFIQISDLTFGIILLLVQFNLVQFGVWSALYTFLFIMIFYPIFAQGARKFITIVLIFVLVVEVILVSIYLIDRFVDSFQFMSDYWISRFVIADLAILIAWVGSHSFANTLKETPYILKLD